MNEDKKNNILKVMELNGNLKSNEDTIMSIIEIIYSKYDNKKLKKITIDDIRSIAREIIEEIIPIYDNVFTNEDILDIIKFYESDVGKMYLKKMPIVSIESMKIGTKFGEKIYNMMSIVEKDFQ